MLVRNNVIAVPLAADKHNLLSFFPQHKVVSANGSGDYLVVPRRMEYALELKRLGLTKVELTKNFNYIGRWIPFQHQKITTEFLISNPRAFCLNDMGTGKTASCIWAAEFLRQCRIVKRVLIVSLISCMKTVWEKELFGICMQRHVAIAYGTAEERKTVIDSEPDYLIINPDGVKIVEDWIRAYAPDLIIIDEASAYKHHATKKYKSLARLIQPNTRIWLLTGTPTATAPTDIYGLVKLVNPHAMTQSFTQFKNEIMIRIPNSNFKWVPKMNATETVIKFMQPAIRFAKEDCLDLPPVTYIHRATSLSKEQRAAFGKMKESYRFERANGAIITAQNAAVKLIKLMQICLGVVYGDDGKHQILDCQPRLDDLDAILEEAGGSEKCVIYVPFKGVISLLEKHLGKKHDIAIVTGDTSAAKRGEIFTQFQMAGAPQHLIAHPQTTSHGITLTKSHNTIWYGPILNTEHYIQANNRQDRPGQIHGVNIIHLSADPFEDRLYKALADREKLQDTILDLYAEMIH